MFTLKNLQKSQQIQEKLLILKEYPIFNYSIAYDRNNKEQLFYEEYPGSIVDIAQLQIMLEKAKGYGYKNASFILDRGYFSKNFIHLMKRTGIFICFTVVRSMLPSRNY